MNYLKLALVFVIINQRLSFLVIYLKTILDCINVVVLALNKGAAASVADALFLWFKINQMIRSAALFANTASGQTVNTSLVGNFNINYIFNVDAHFVQSLSLRNGSRKTVKNKSILAVVLSKSVFNDSDNNFVGDKLSSIQGTSMYLASLDSVNTLLTQKNPSLSILSEYNNVLCSVSGSELDIELMFHKSQTILTSDYGLSTYDAYLDQDFLTSLLASSRQPEQWLLRSYQKTLFSDPKWC